MQTKNLIKIIKAEATVLVSLIENLPDDGNVQSYEVDMLINKIQALNNIAVHLLPDEQTKEEKFEENQLFVETTDTDTANKEIEENWKAETEKLAEELEIARKNALEVQENARKQADAARKAAEEEEARLFAEAEAAKRAEELEAARKAAEEMARKAEAEELARKQAEEAARKAAAEEEARRIAAAEAAKRAEELEKVRRIAIEEAEKKAAAAEEARKAAEEAARKAEEETRKAQSLADMFADNTADVEQTYTAENEQQDEVSAPAEPIKAETKPSTLADRFQQNTPSVNDVLAGLEKKANLASRFNSRPITNLRKAIKINDRIRFINELFDHDSVQYEQTIDTIEQSANINEALDKLFCSRSWNQEDETTVDFLELVYQRFKAQ